MLLRFFVSNFMSFSEEVEFNMFSGSFKTHKDHVYRNGKINLVKAAAIYGANGSGKSNFIKAVHFLHDAVVNGDLAENEYKFVPFRLDSDYLNKPSTFGLECKIGRQYFEYSISVKEDAIVFESLYQTTPGKEDVTMIYERRTENGKTEIEVNPKFIQSKKEKYRFEIYAEDLLPSQSLLFKIRDKLQEAKVVFDWFKQNLWILYPNTEYFLTARLCFDNNYKNFLNKLLPLLGTGMDGIDIDSIPFPDFFGEDDKETQEDFKEKLKGKSGIIQFIKNNKEFIARREGKEYFVNKIRTFNTDDNGKRFEFEPEEQSDGTRRMLDLIPAIQKVGNEEAVFFIDEMERSLHPMLIKELLRYFMEHPSKGQLVFTTHESNLLDLDVFRQDEIWLVEKNEAGSTSMYPLSDFKPRYDLDIRKGYLAGRFGAVPFLGNLNDLNWKHAKKQAVQKG